ncbi:hypothetical protein PACTADRAFT_51495, partial [Pachysolen tannophilus NRRL Y-2460]
MTIESIFGNVNAAVCQRYNFSNKISWSKNGFIAYASPDLASDCNLCLTYMECLDGHSYQLAPPFTYSVRPAAQEQAISNQINNPNFKIPPAPELVLVAYSQNSSELMVSDIMGNFTVFMSGASKNSPGHAPQILADSLNEFEIIYRDTPSGANSQSLPPQVQGNFFSDRLTFSEESPYRLLAFKWLNVDKPVIAEAPALRINTTPQTMVSTGCASAFGAANGDFVGNAYTYNINQYKSHGAMHPIPGKQACIGIRKNGEVCLWFQGEHGIDITRVSSFLEPLASSSSQTTDSNGSGEDGWISHASIGFQRNGTIIATIYCSVSQTLKSYKIIINWGYLINSAIQQQKIPNFVTPDALKDTVQLKIERILKENVNQIDPKTGLLQYLSHIEMISPNHITSTALDIFVVFETKSNSGTISTIYNYQIDENSTGFSNVFASINGNGEIVNNNVNSDAFSTNSINYKNIIRCSDSVLSIRSLNADTLISIAFKKGSVEFLDRATMKKIENNYVKPETNSSINFNNPSLSNSTNLELPQTIGSLLDAGFEFPKIDAEPLYVCVSPNISALVYMEPDSNILRLQCLRRSLVLNSSDSENFVPKKGYLLLTAVAFAYCHTVACFTGSFSTDLYATIQLEIERISKIASDEYTSKLKISIIEECHRAINFSLDYGREQTDKLLTNPPFQRMLSLQMTLGTGKSWERTKTGKIAWAMLNLRCCCFAITITLRALFHQIQRGINNSNPEEVRRRADNILANIGVIRWCMDFIILLNQEFVEINEQLVNDANSNKLLNDFIVIPLILGKVPRALLLFSIAGIKRIHEYIKKSIESSNVSKDITSLPSFEAAERLNSIILDSPIKLDVFEKFLLDTDNTLRNMKFDKVSSYAIEQKLICQAIVPAQYVEPVKKFCQIYFRIIKKEFNVADLFFYNVDWLKLNGYQDSNLKMNKMGGSHLDLEVILNHKHLTTSEEYHNNYMNPFVNKKSHEPLIDGLSKNIILGSNIKRCICCGAIKTGREDNVFNTISTNHWTSAFARTCFCSGNWV